MPRVSIRINYFTHLYNAIAVTDDTLYHDRAKDSTKSLSVDILLILIATGWKKKIITFTKPDLEFGIFCAVLSHGFINWSAVLSHIKIGQCVELKKKGHFTDLRIKTILTKTKKKYITKPQQLQTIIVVHNQSWSKI